MAHPTGIALGPVQEKSYAGEFGSNLVVFSTEQPRVAFLVFAFLAGTGWLSEL
jgi:hypothetical protein